MLLFAVTNFLLNEIQFHFNVLKIFFFGRLSVIIYIQISTKKLDVL